MPHRGSHGTLAPETKDFLQLAIQVFQDVDMDVSTPTDLDGDCGRTLVRVLMRLVNNRRKKNKKKTEQGTKKRKNSVRWCCIF